MKTKNVLAPSNSIYSVQSEQMHEPVERMERNTDR